VTCPPPPRPTPRPPAGPPTSPSATTWSARPPARAPLGARRTSEPADTRCRAQAVTIASRNCWSAVSRAADSDGSSFTAAARKRDVERRLREFAGHRGQHARMPTPRAPDQHDRRIDQRDRGRRAPRPRLGPAWSGPRRRVPCRAPPRPAAPARRSRPYPGGEDRARRRRLSAASPPLPGRPSRRRRSQPARPA